MTRRLVVDVVDSPAVRAVLRQLAAHIEDDMVPFYEGCEDPNEDQTPPPGDAGTSEAARMVADAITRAITPLDTEEPQPLPPNAAEAARRYAAWCAENPGADADDHHAARDEIALDLVPTYHDEVVWPMYHDLMSAMLEVP